jgi:hypothetical protein
MNHPWPPARSATSFEAHLLIALIAAVGLYAVMSLQIGSRFPWLSHRQSATLDRLPTQAEIDAARTLGVNDRGLVRYTLRQMPEAELRRAYADRSESRLIGYACLVEQEAFLRSLTPDAPTCTFETIKERS